MPGGVGCVNLIPLSMRQGRCSLSSLTLFWNLFAQLLCTSSTLWCAKQRHDNRDTGAGHGGSQAAAAAAVVVVVVLLFSVQATGRCGGDG